MSDIRTQWNNLRSALEEEAARSKQSEDVIAGLARAYVELGAIERNVVDDILAEWLLSEDITYRFDARALVRRLKVHGALPALRSLSQRLSLDSSARSRHEHTAVLETIAELQRDEPAPN